MNQTSVTQIKNGKVALPQGLKRQWNKRDVIVFPSADGFYIKPISPTPFSVWRQRLKQLGKLIKPSDLEQAIREARQKIYKGNS